MATIYNLSTQAPMTASVTTADYLASFSGQPVEAAAMERQQQARLIGAPAPVRGASVFSPLSKKDVVAAGTANTSAAVATVVYEKPKRLSAILPGSYKQVSSTQIAEAASDAEVEFELPDLEGWRDSVKASLLIVNKEGRLPSGMNKEKLWFQNLFITGMTYQEQERVSIHETYGYSIAAFFGRSVPNMTITGVVYDTVQNDWFQQLKLLYSNYIRGSQAIRYGLDVYLNVSNRTMKIHIVNFSCEDRMMNDQAVHFSMQLLIERYICGAPLDQSQTLSNELAAASRGGEVAPAAAESIVVYGPGGINALTPTLKPTVNEGKETKAADLPVIREISRTPENLEKVNTATHAVAEKSVSFYSTPDDARDDPALYKARQLDTADKLEASANVVIAGYEAEIAAKEKELAGFYSWSGHLLGNRAALTTDIAAIKGNPGYIAAVERRDRAQRIKNAFDDVQINADAADKSKEAARVRMQATVNAMTNKTYDSPEMKAKAAQEIAAIETSANVLGVKLDMSKAEKKLESIGATDTYNKYKGNEDYAHIVLRGYSGTVSGEGGKGDYVEISTREQTALSADKNKSITPPTVNNPVTMTTSSVAPTKNPTVNPASKSAAPVTQAPPSTVTVVAQRTGKTKEEVVRTNPTTANPQENVSTTEQPLTFPAATSPVSPAKLATVVVPGIGTGTVPVNGQPVKVGDTLTTSSGSFKVTSKPERQRLGTGVTAVHSVSPGAVDRTVTLIQDGGPQ